MTLKDLSVLQLVRRVRNRLWLADARDRLGTALWASALLVLVLGLCHLLYRPVSPFISIVSAVLPVATVIMKLLLRPPSWLAAARVADRQANAGSLLLTAWDLEKRHADTSDTEQMILWQAQLQLPEWQSKISVQPVPGQTTFPVLPILLAGIGAALLSLPGSNHDHPEILASSPGKPLPADPADTNPLAEFIQAVNTREEEDAFIGTEPDRSRKNRVREGQASAAQRETSDSSSSEGEKYNEHPSPSSGHSRSSATQMPEARELARERTTQAPASPGNRSGNGDQAGIHPGAAPEQATSSLPATSLQLEELRMERTSERSVSSRGGILLPAPGPDVPATRDQSRPERRPAVSPDSLHPGSLLSPVQHRLVTHYLHQLQLVQ